MQPCYNAGSRFQRKLKVILMRDVLSKHFWRIWRAFIMQMIKFWFFSFLKLQIEFSVILIETVLLNSDRIFHSSDPYLTILHNFDNVLSSSSLDPGLMQLWTKVCNNIHTSREPGPKTASIKCTKLTCLLQVLVHQVSGILLHLHRSLSIFCIVSSFSVSS